ncbi:5'-methylthioadenosine/S-adenosylhomocysteine nucleosidase [Shouchella lonarensis]|uniref:5'-methylthioadenosine/S-adenosylhomocysteine nucleosidase n=1 Tax=Shouchella lonarensis TaxID=1464122 RepID=A0A1G6JJI8_9BACI|nr:5'-methylthioadenosine/S-adenosylhomocysteine nucleosidase [Shouchella lonarensis]SDC18952.1 methylthioadenosine nucleosidase /adenosylhomocysteine nucleosidase [Shouchella lonarensis]
MRVGIIGAMEEEVNELRGKMVEPVVETVAHCTFTLGKIEGVEVVLTLCGIGKANAAMATALLNDRYRPDYVVNTGVAGGLHEAMAVGDIVISTEVRYHDVDATVFGYEYGQVPGSVPAYMPAKKLIDIAKQAAQEVGIRTETGLVLTGDSFMGEATRVQQVKGQFPTAYCVEMEAGAIAQVCHQFETPFVIIRALSDVAGGEAHGSYETFLKKAADHSAQQVLHMLRALAA